MFRYQLSLATILYITVFLTGSAVLVFEVGAVRLLAPYFGSSLTVLSSVLSVILLALSLGYYFGGKLADKYPDPKILFGIIGTAGLLMLMLSWILTHNLAESSLYFGLSYGPLFVSFFGFFIPALLLGIDSPFVSKLLTERTQNNEGETVGTIFFFSTIGSIVGSLAAGFWLIPNYGIIDTIAFVSVALILWSTIICLGYYSSSRLLLLYLAFCLVVGVLVFTQSSKSLVNDKDIKILYERDGLYSHLVVFDKDLNGTTYRFLKNDTNHSSAINPNTNDIILTYAQYSTLYRTMIGNSKNYLVLGGGAFTIPRHVHEDNPDIKIDTVEIEPYLADIAYQYFGLPHSPLLQNYAMDARLFLQSTSTKYDVIFSDVMNSGHYIPPHLATQEFFLELAEHLSTEGVIMMNYIGSLDLHGKSLTGSLIKTISSVFPNYKIVALGDTNQKTLQNLLIIMRKEELPIEFDQAMIKNYFNNYSFQSNSHFVSTDKFDFGDEDIFTDDTSAMEILLAKQTRLHGE